jgi:CBS domain-containing protein
VITDTVPAPTIVAGLRQALRPHAPFGAMADADLDHLVRHARLRYFAPGEVIQRPESERPAHCHVVKQGVVRNERPGPGGEPTPVGEILAGEMFPLGALLGHRGVTSTYRAQGDVFCLAFPAAVFDELIARSPVFRDACTRRLAYLLDLLRTQLRSEYATDVVERRGFATPLGELVRQAAIVVAEAEPLDRALKVMEAQRIGSLPVVDAAAHPLGIFTRQDVIGRVVLPQRPLSTPIASVMSAPAIALPVTATAGDAALIMARHGIRHVIVTGPDGRVSGVVSERDLFALQRLSVRELASSIRRAADLPTLVHCAADIRALSHALVAHGVGSAMLTRLISGLNDGLTVRTIELALPQFDLSGLTLCWLGLGSEGRHEQTIATDQDNGLLFVANDEASDPQQVRERLLPFAREVNGMLDRCGYPFCKGDVMARNPRWCLSLTEWQLAFAEWIDRGDPQSLIAANIFFDFRPLWGRTELAAELRSGIAVRAMANPRFLKQMSDNALANRPPLSWRGAIAAQADDGQAGIDLKRQASMPMTDAARIFALAAGVIATNTRERLEEAGRKRQMAEADIRSWCDAFDYLQMLRLRTQHRRLAGEIPPARTPNFVPLDSLSSLDQRILNNPLRQVRKIQQRLQLDYP